MTRVAITGRGVVSALALGRDRHLERLYAGESGVSPTPPDVVYHRACPLRAAVLGFERKQSIKTRMLRKLLAPSGAYAVVAAGEALAEAGLTDQDEVLHETGVYAGSVCIDFDPEIFIPAIRESLDEAGALNIHRFATRGLFLIDPLFLVKTLPNGGVGGIAIEHRATGPSLNITNGVVSGMQAVLAAYDAVLGGDAEVALAGGCDSLLGMDSVAEHLVSGRLAGPTTPPSRACRPFCDDRDGYVLGEAAAFLVLESEEHARSRKAPILGFLLGGGQTAGREETSPRGLAAAGRLALGAAGEPRIDALFGDGTALARADVMEEAACSRLFDGRRMPYTAATAAVGFTGAASGPLSLVHVLEAMSRQALPPLLNCERAERSCSLELSSVPRDLEIEHALVWNSDLGLKNAAVVVGRGESW